MIAEAGLLAEVRMYLNEPTAGFWTDAELQAMIVQAFLQFQKDVLCTWETVTAVDNSAYKNLPDGFIRIKNFRNNQSTEKETVLVPQSYYEIKNNQIRIRTALLLDVEVYFADATIATGNYTYSDDISKIGQYAIAQLAVSKAYKKGNMNLKASQYAFGEYLLNKKNLYKEYRQKYNGV